LKKYLPFAIVFVVLAADQALKIWVKTHLELGDGFAVIGNWFYLHFVENNGMAFGMEFGGSTGKILLTVLRLCVISFIIYLIYTYQKRGLAAFGQVCMSLVLAGALGNIVDSVLYGVVFKYESLFFGRVVDMLYFPIFTGYLPDWVPVWGGEYCVFFRPVFNIADAAISVGMFLIIIFQKRFFEGME
jgi:signal peptidase II